MLLQVHIDSHIAVAEPVKRYAAILDDDAALQQSGKDLGRIEGGVDDLQQESTPAMWGA